MKHLNSNTEEALKSKTELFNVKIENDFPHLFGDKETISFSVTVDEQRQEVTLVLDGRMGSVYDFKTISSRLAESTT